MHITKITHAFTSQPEWKYCLLMIEDSDASLIRFSVELDRWLITALVSIAMEGAFRLTKIRRTLTAIPGTDRVRLQP